MDGTALPTSVRTPSTDGHGRPRLSVCVPTFNRPDLVQRAIRSIVESGSAVAGELEIIVSDNSPEVSEEACRQALAAWGGRSLYIGNRPEIGLVANFNQCIERAHGEYVLFVQDDDSLLPGAGPAILEALAAREAPDPVLLFGVHIVDRAGRVLRRQEFCGDASIGPRDAVHRLLSDNGVAWFPGVVVSHEAYDAVGPFDGAFGNAMDLDMWVRLFARSGIRCVPRAISAYSVHAGSATQSMGFDGAAVAKLMAVFARAREREILPAETLRRCQANYFHQFILGAASARLRLGDVAGARTILTLFDLPSIRSLGPSPAWGPVRIIVSVLARCPSAVVRRFMKWVDRLDLVGRVRAAQNRGRDGRLVC